MTIRLSISSLAGTSRTLVAVGTARLAVMLMTVRAAAPRSLLTSVPSERGGAARSRAGGAAGAARGAAAAGPAGPLGGRARGPAAPGAPQPGPGPGPGRRRTGCGPVPFGRAGW